MVGVVLYFIARMSVADTFLIKCLNSQSVYIPFLVSLGHLMIAYETIAFISLRRIVFFLLDCICSVVAL